MKSPKTQQFVYEVTVEGLEYNTKNLEGLFGKGATTNEDFGKDALVSEFIYDVFKHAATNVLMLQMQHIGKCKCEPQQMNEKDKHYYDFLQDKYERFEAMRKSVKFVGMY